MLKALEKRGSNNKVNYLWNEFKAHWPDGYIR